MANVFHAGDGNLHPLVCYDGAKPGEAERAEELAGLIVKACVDAGGSITGEHGVGVDKKRYMPAMFDEPDLATFQRLRCAFDPDGRANPGKVMPTRGCAARCPGPTAATRSSRRAGGALLMHGGARPPPRARSSAPRSRPPPRPARRCASAAAARSSAGRARAPPDALELSTAGLDAIVEHNAGDLTAVLEAGVPLADAQATFAKAGQMLALDPPDGGATVGGVVASGDTGPLRARYGGPRDLVVGMRVALSDGTLAKSGGKVIKNVAGYDIAKLFTGSFGTLGAIVEVSVRLHPLAPDDRHRARRGDADPDELARGAAALGAVAARAPRARRPLGGAAAARVLARFAGRRAAPAGRGGRALLRRRGPRRPRSSTTTSSLWDEQRAGQRGPLVVKVSSLPTRLPDAAPRRPTSSARRWWAAPRSASPGCGSRSRRPAAVERLRRDFIAAVLDRPADLDVDPSGAIDPATRALMQRVKERFDPAGVCV